MLITFPAACPTYNHVKGLIKIKSSRASILLHHVYMYNIHEFMIEKFIDLIGVIYMHSLAALDSNLS